MSSARANAAARARRAGGAEPPAPQQNMFQQGGRGPQQTEQMPQQMPQRIAIPDAIGIITYRLSQVENFINKIQNQEPTENENAVSVDEAVFNNIIDRIEYLEQPENSSSLKDEEINSLKKTVLSLENDMALLKDITFKLQTFSMETNQKLISVMLNKDKSNKIVNKTSKNNNVSKVAPEKFSANDDEDGVEDVHEHGEHDEAGGENDDEDGGENDDEGRVEHRCENGENGGKDNNLNLNVSE